jgi:branched-chain amino acid transport system permease protein
MNTVTRRKERIDRPIKAVSDDIFCLSSVREIAYLVIPRLLPIAGILLLAFLVPPYWKKVMIITFIMAMMALSWDFLASCGLVSLGQALFFALGAYSTGAVSHHLGLPPYLSIPAGTVIGAFLSTLCIFPALRLRGIYFSMVTLIIPLMLMRVIETTGILGGTEGTRGLTPLPGVTFAMAVSMIALWATFFGLRRLISSDYGLIFVALKDNDRGVEASGLSILWFKVQAIFIGSFICCFCGAFMTHYYMSVGMSAFALDLSVFPMAASVVGGMGTLAGPLLGAIILGPLSEALRSFGSFRIVIYAALLGGFVATLPEGLFHYCARKYQQIERWVEAPGGLSED